MNLPKYTSTSQIERYGVHKVGCILTEIGLIFRETSNTDTGIDGQIEYVDEYQNATGRIIAVQIKSGSSYLHNNGDYWRYYVDETHLNYWKNFSIPVLLLVYNPDDDIIYYKDVTNNTLNTIKKVDIPKTNILNEYNKDSFLSYCRDIDTNQSKSYDITNLHQASNEPLKVFDCYFKVRNITEGEFLFQVDLKLMACNDDVSILKIELHNTHVFRKPESEEIDYLPFLYFIQQNIINIEKCGVDDFEKKVKKEYSSDRQNVLDLFIEKNRQKSLSFHDLLITTRQMDGYDDLPLNGWSIYVYYNVDKIIRIPIEMKVLDDHSYYYWNNY